MATYVLVHGSWHGGWCWQKVVPLLRRAGHAVYSPTLTGLGERVHLANPQIGLETHIQDVVQVLTYEDLHDVVLVGHSFGGVVASGVAGRAADRLTQLVYVDAVLLEDGHSFMDAEPVHGPSFRALAQKAGDGWRVPAPPVTPGLFGVSVEADLQWMASRLAPQPLLTYEQPVPPWEAAAAAVGRTYIACTAWTDSPVRRFAQQARAAPGWRYRELPTGHDAMITMPGKLTELLLDVA